MPRLSKEVSEDPLKNPTQAKIIYYLAGSEGNSNTLSKDLKKSQTSLFDNIKILEEKNILIKEGKYYRTNAIKILTFVIEIIKNNLLDAIEVYDLMKKPNNYLMAFSEKTKSQYVERSQELNRSLNKLDKEKQKIINNYYIQLLLNEFIAYYNEDSSLEDTLNEFILLFGNTTKENLPSEKEILEFYELCKKTSKQDLFNEDVKLTTKSYLEKINSS